MKKLGCFTCFIWLSALYIYRYISRSDLETSKKTRAAPFLIFREDIIKVDRKSAYFFDKILSGFFMHIKLPENEQNILCVIKNILNASSSDFI